MKMRHAILNCSPNVHCLKMDKTAHKKNWTEEKTTEEIGYTGHL